MWSCTVTAQPYPWQTQYPQFSLEDILFPKLKDQGKKAAQKISLAKKRTNIFSFQKTMFLIGAEKFGLRIVNKTSANF